MKAKIIITLANFFVAALLSYSPIVSAINYDEQSLGQLFTSPAERHKIDSAKRGDVAQVSSRKVTPSSVSVNGVVIRSKGKNSVWVNGKIASGNEMVGGVKVFAKSASKDNIKIPVLVDGQSVKIKPGQSWSEESDTIVDSY